MFSFKSMVEYMKEQLWCICWKAFGLRVRSQLAIDHSSIDDDSKQKQSCWANMPPELLTEIFTMIEASESDWPSRKNVVYCAGVCRSWRKIMKEIVKCPQLSGNLTFPISLKQPGPVGSLTQCIMETDDDDEFYYLFLHPYEAPISQEGKFLLAAKRVNCTTYTEYIISINYKDISKGSSSCIGILRSNFLGTKFMVYDAHPPNAATKSHSPKVPAANNPVSSISYELTALGNRYRGPRQMRCEINTIPANSSSLPLHFKLKGVKLVLKKTIFRWQSKLWCWCLKFIGRATFASVKKFKLVACLDNETGAKEQDTILQLEKVTRGLFTMDYQYPISAFQAFAISLSTFHTKVACK